MRKYLTLLAVCIYSLFSHAQNVGIGTPNPQNKLHIAGGLRVDTLSGAGNGLLKHNTQGVVSSLPLTGNTTDVLRGDGTFAPVDNNGGGGTGNGNVGFGTWGDCSMNNISEYNPVASCNVNPGFGFSVAISGNHAIIGSYVNYSSPACVFLFNGTAWIQQQKLTPGDAVGGAFSEFDFGYSVSVSGNHVIVGAPAQIGSRVGSAYIFHFNGSEWVQQQKLTASDGVPYDDFGFSVSISGDYAIVGAESNDGNKGAAYVFHFDGSNWIQQQKLTASDGASPDHFGTSVSISGDYAIVGAYFDDDGKGSAYIFHFDGVTWVQQQKVLVNENDVKHFGNSVSISDEYAIVGAPGDESFKGAAFIFRRNGSTWSILQRLIIPDGVVNDRFGQSVSISGDYALVGASSTTEGKEGSAYIFQNISGSWIFLQKVTRPGGSAGDLFGGSTAIGNKRFLIGAKGITPRGMAFFGKVN